MFSFWKMEAVIAKEALEDETSLFSDRALSANTIEARRIDSINRLDVRLQSILFTNTHLAYGRYPCKGFLK
jgi:hypothetical protein